MDIKSNLEEQDNQKAKKICDHHPQPEYFINISGEGEKILVCPLCVIENNYSGKNLLYSQFIRQSNDETIFTNWPPLSNQNLYKQVLDSIQVEEKIDYTQLRTSTIDFFSDFKKELVSLIEFYQKSMMIKIDQLESHKDDLLNLYNTISEKDNIKKVVELDVSEQPESLKNIINQLILKKEENTRKLEEFINSHERAKYIVDLNTVSQLRKNFMSVADQYIKQGLYELKTSYSNIQNNMSANKLQLLELLNIPTNYLKQEYQERISTKLSMLPLIFFDSEEDEKVIMENKKPLSVNNIKMYEEIEKAIGQHEEKGFYSINLRMDRKKFQVLEVNPTQVFEFTQASCNNESNSLIEVNKVTRQNSSGYIQLISKFILKENYMYRIVFSISSDFLLVTSVLSKSKASSQSNFYGESFSFATKKDWYRLNKLQKGKNILDEYGNNIPSQKFVMEICINKKLFAISDYPLQNNVCCLSEDQQSTFASNCTEEPRISFHICYGNGAKVGDVLEIHDFSSYLI